MGLKPPHRANLGDPRGTVSRNFSKIDPLARIQPPPRLRRPSPDLGQGADMGACVHLCVGQWSAHRGRLLLAGMVVAILGQMGQAWASSVPFDNSQPNPMPGHMLTDSDGRHSRKQAGGPGGRWCNYAQWMVRSHQLWNRHEHQLAGLQSRPPNRPRWLFLRGTAQDPSLIFAVVATRGMEVKPGAPEAPGIFVDDNSQAKRG